MTQDYFDRGSGHNVEINNLDHFLMSIQAQLFLEVFQINFVLRINVHNCRFKRKFFKPGQGVNPFPNADRYTIDVSRNTDDYRLPTRQTATQMYASWLGALDAPVSGSQVTGYRFLEL